MDPVTLIVSALAAGASAALKPTAEKAVKDAYEGVKALIKKKYDRVSVEVIENDPSDTTRRDILANDLQRTEAPADEDVLFAAQRLMAEIETHAPDAAADAGIDIEVFKVGKNLSIDSVVHGSRSAVRGTNWEVGGDANIHAESTADRRLNPPTRQ